MSNVDAAILQQLYIKLLSLWMNFFLLNFHQLIMHYLCTLARKCVNLCESLPTRQAYVNHVFTQSGSLIKDKTTSVDFSLFPMCWTDCKLNWIAPLNLTNLAIKLRKSKIWTYLETQRSLGWNFWVFKHYKVRVETQYFQNSFWLHYILLFVSLLIP